MVKLQHLLGAKSVSRVRSMGRFSLTLFNSGLPEREAGYYMILFVLPSSDVGNCHENTERITILRNS